MQRDTRAGINALFETSLTLMLVVDSDELGIFSYHNSGKVRKRKKRDFLTTSCQYYT